MGNQYTAIIRLAFWILSGLTTLDVYASMTIELGMFFGFTPTGFFDSLSGERVPTDSTWCLLAYALAAIILPSGVVLVWRRFWFGAPIYLLGVVMERLDWAFHSAVFRTLGRILPNIELLLFVLAASVCALGWATRSFEE